MPARPTGIVAGSSEGPMKHLRSQHLRPQKLSHGCRSGEECFHAVLLYGERNKNIRPCSLAPAAELKRTRRGKVERENIRF